MGKGYLTKSTNLDDGAIGVPQHNVFRLEVAVDDPKVLHKLQRREHLHIRWVGEEVGG